MHGRLSSSIWIASINNKVRSLTHARWHHVTATWHFGCCHVETPRCGHVHLYGWDYVATTWWCNVTWPRGGHMISTIQMHVVTTWCFNVAATKVSPPPVHHTATFYKALLGGGCINCCTSSTHLSVPGLRFSRNRKGWKATETSNPSGNVGCLGLNTLSI